MINPSLFVGFTIFCEYIKSPIQYNKRVSQLLDIALKQMEEILSKGRYAANQEIQL